MTWHFYDNCLQKKHYKLIYSEWKNREIQICLLSICWYFFFFPEIIEYSTLLVEAAFDTADDKQHREKDDDQQQEHTITEHFNIVTTESAIQSDEMTTVMVDPDHDGSNEIIETIETIETDTEIEIIPTVTIRKVQIEPDYSGETDLQQDEVVSYQRYGRVDKKIITKPFKCHLCGFSCLFKDSLLSHFKQVHPYWHWHCQSHSHQITHRICAFHSVLYNPSVRAIHIYFFTFTL